MRRIPASGSADIVKAIFTGIFSGSRSFFRVENEIVRFLMKVRLFASGHSDLASAVFASLAAMSTGSAHAAYTQWTGAASNDWTNPANWSAGTLPGLADTTVINTTTPNAPVVNQPGVTVSLIRLNDTATAGSNASLTIENAGSLDSTAGHNGYLILGYTDVATLSTVTVTGAGSRLSTGQYIYVGLGNTTIGTLTVSNGAVVNVGTALSVASGDSSRGTVSLSGLGSQVNVGSTFTAGGNGEGAVTISGGAVLTSGTASPPLIVGPAGGVVTPNDAIGSGTGGHANLTVSGSGSTLTSSNPLVVGGTDPALIPFYQENYGLDATSFFMGEGALTISGAGTVSSGIGLHSDPRFVNNTYIGGTPGSTGTVTVTDPGSSWTVGGSLMVGGDGKGTLTIADNGHVSAAAMTIAENAGSSGTLNIGAAAGAAPVAPGILDTARVTFGAGTGNLTFNHTDTSGNYRFPAVISGTGAVNVYSGKTVMTAASTYAGPTTVQGGTLAGGTNNVFSPNSDYVVQPAGTLDLRGFDQSVASVVNAGLVRIASDPGAVLTTKNYVGHNGTIAIDTYLGGDNSPSDRLVIDGGTATGTSKLAIANVGGPGALTLANGIPVVVATNGGTTSAQAFSLAGEARGGAYDYRLYRGGVGGAVPDDWFLRSDFVVGPDPVEPPVIEQDEVFPVDPPPSVLPPGEYPIVGPELATYAVVQPLARELGLTMLGTMHERIGDTLTDDAGGSNSNGLARSAWARVFGQQIDNRYQTFTDASANGHQIGVQAGIDLWRGSTMPGHHDAAGVYFAYGNSNVDVDGLVTNAAATGYVPSHTGSVNLNGYSGGAYWTHYGPGGWYVDAVLQGTWYDGDATTQYARLPLSGSGFATSLEAGYPFRLPLGPGFVLEPQAQIIWQHVGLNEEADGLGAVDPGSTSGVTGRIGLRGQWTIERANGEVWQPYVRTNIWRDWGAQATTVYSGVDQVPLRQQFTRMDVAAGVSAKLNTRMSLYGQFGYQFSISSSATGSQKGVWGDVGLRYAW
ncbi:autotransporter family protein [Paraburkholderia nodosa]|uniref:autotransporter family protein n=1 Tax=Paraburkholderia nodosa TaxID=392320 RepID=UPI001FDF7B6F|nr:autotransporter outer membrane beta-barrel domain-containing protein [Paraburkholderia nodosa]